MPDNENILATIEPETREETFLQDIADGTQTLTPAVRKEEFLRRISAKPGLPSITESDEGKVLTVESGETAWGEVSSLPEITAQDEGKVLTVDNGEAVWGEGGGGAGVIILTAPEVPLPIPEGVDVTTFLTPGGGLGITTASGNLTIVTGKTDSDIVGPSNPLFVIESVDPEYGDMYWYTPIYVSFNEEGLQTINPVPDDPTSEVWAITVTEETTLYYVTRVSEGGNKFIVPRNTALKWVRLGGGD